MAKNILIALVFLMFFQFAPAQDMGGHDKNLIYVLKIQRDIGSTSWVHTQEAFKEAESLHPACIIVHMNTYGGQVIFADSIRTKILNSTIPVHVFIDNNAASAGALISIACDSIYMRPGSNIGAATVVDQSGQKLPDKYQSYMRSTMRSTAEAHGKDTIVTGNDTIYQWVRDPHIAEAMVDESISIPNITDSGKLVTFTTLEAIEHGFCEGEAKSLSEVAGKLGIRDPEFVTYQPSFYDGLKGFLTSPVLQGILILIIIGGIYFELQTPGIGFPSIAALTAAILYFSPLYIDGLAENWEILIFVIGLILIGLEIFVVPGFGITGISGIVLVVSGLILSLINNVQFDFTGVEYEKVVQAFLVVMISCIVSIAGAVWLTGKMFTKGPISKIALHTSQDIELGYIGIDPGLMSLTGCQGIAETILRPSGKIVINDELYDATAETGFIDKGTLVRVKKVISGQLVVEKA